MEFPSDTLGQETAPLASHRQNHGYYSPLHVCYMKRHIVEQGLNYVDSTVNEKTDLFEIRVENIAPTEEKKIFYAPFKNKAKKKNLRRETSSP